MTLRRAVLAFVILAISALPAFAGFDEGRKFYDDGNWQNAILHLRPAAENGDARALVLLANMYSEGYGVVQDRKEAFTLYYRAAVLNNPDAILAVATFYQQGIGVDQNDRLAIAWFERGARIGQPTAAFFYAIHLYQGRKGTTFDMKPDVPQAYKWFRIVANLKDLKEVSEIAQKLSVETA